MSCTGFVRRISNVLVFHLSHNMGSTVHVVRRPTLPSDLSLRRVVPDAKAVCVAWAIAKFVCLLCVACCVLFVVCCVLFVVCCLLFVVCCVLFVVCCLLFVVVVVGGGGVARGVCAPLVWLAILLCRVTTPLCFSKPTVLPTTP